MKLKDGAETNAFCTSKSNVDIVGTVKIYDVPKKLLDSINELGIMLGFKTRSSLIKFLLEYIYNNYNYLLNSDASVYLFVDYEVNSMVSKFILDLQSKFSNDLEVISIKTDNNISRIIFCYTGELNKINGIVKNIVKLKGVKKIKFVGI